MSRALFIYLQPDGPMNKKKPAVSPRITEKLILALDTDDLRSARRFVNLLYPAVGLYKIGPVLFTAYGPGIVETVRKKGGGVFLDLKFHDIPNTVAHAVRQATRLGVMMMTLHTCGGQEMMRRAADAAREEAAALKVRKPLLVGVTVLTSDTGAGNTLDTVLERAQLAKAAGLDGVVCSVLETAQVRKICGPDFVIVTPGIRPKGADVQDQKRVATAADAVSAGSTYLVVGRPILEAEDPLLAVETLF